MTRLIPKPKPIDPLDTLTQRIRAKAFALGFSKIGLSQANRLGLQNGLEHWLAAGHQGEMCWMGKNVDKRQDPSLVLTEARTILSLGINYYVPVNHSELPQHGKISRYAWGTDYHLVFKSRLKELADWIGYTVPSVKKLFYSDTGPIMDKIWAHKAGLGWIGKHSNLITRDLGSWIFLGEILLDIELTYDQEVGNYCGTCQRCIEACPTKAIVAPYIVDSRLCISYLTIELKGPIPRELRALIGTRIFGCDDCQDVCPWNRFAQPSLEKAFYPTAENHSPILMNLIKITEKDFSHQFRLSPIKRCGYVGFLRNVAVALGNSGDPKVVSSLEVAIRHPESLVRSHGAWALGQIGGANARSVLWKTSHLESDPTVREEIRMALTASSSHPTQEKRNAHLPYRSNN